MYKSVHSDCDTLKVPKRQLNERIPSIRNQVEACSFNSVGLFEGRVLFLEDSYRINPVKCKKGFLRCKEMARRSFFFLSFIFVSLFSFVCFFFFLS